MRMLKVSFVVVFFVLTAMPVLQWWLHLIDISALDEKRSLAPVPDFVGKVLHGDGRLSGDINQWFDDHYGFRSLLVRFKHQLDYWIFRHSDKIFIGREGWLFQRDFLRVEIRAERAEGSEGRLVRERYLQLARYLSRRNIRLIVISNPDKQTIYPQYLPSDAPRLPTNNSFQRLRAFLKSRQEWIYIDGQDVLQRRCEGYRTFNLIDIHMTLPGGACFVRELVGRVAEAEGRSQPTSDYGLDYTMQASSVGGQASFMSLLWPPTQLVYVPEVVLDGPGPWTEGSFDDSPRGAFEWTYRAWPSHRASKLPPLLLFGDSFLDHYRGAGIQSYFTDIYRVRDTDNLDRALEDLPEGVRYFVYQFIEPYSTFFAVRKLPKDWLD